MAGVLPDHARVPGRRDHRRWLRDDLSPEVIGAYDAPFPGAQDQPHTTITGGGHFVQEDKGPELAAVIIDFIDRTGRRAG